MPATHSSSHALCSRSQCSAHADSVHIFVWFVFPENKHYLQFKTWKILGSESVILPRSLDQTGQQQAGKQTRAPIQMILLEGTTQSKGRPTKAEGSSSESVSLWTTSPHTVVTTGSLGLLLGPQSFSSLEVYQ